MITVGIRSFTNNNETTAVLNLIQSGLTKYPNPNITHCYLTHNRTIIKYIDTTKMRNEVVDVEMWLVNARNLPCMDSALPKFLIYINDDKVTFNKLGSENVTNLLNQINYRYPIYEISCKTGHNISKLMHTPYTLVQNS